MPDHLAGKTPLKPQWFHILLAVADRDLHGSAIMQEVLERTGGEMRLWPGTLYGSLKAMATEGYIREAAEPAGAPVEGGKRRFYGITALGTRVLALEVERLASFVRVARAKQVVDDLGMS